VEEGGLKKEGQSNNLRFLNKDSFIREILNDSLTSGFSRALPRTSLLKSISFLCHCSNLFLASRPLPKDETSGNFTLVPRISSLSNHEAVGYLPMQIILPAWS
jgi:hypothetical protein